ncbi:Mucolipin-2 [Perkinsus olseni]|uniref:Mucolipin-2 n=1 Tax=Perkinsus olseni TaxID=32597 RepID=A0A7J6UPK4_PEROL|nr:Mucolipin-2 [Perkinsus olseni]
MLVYEGPVDTGTKLIGQGVDDAGSLSVRESFLSGFDSLHHQGDWNLYWKSGRFRPSEYANVKPYQKMNHFPRSGCITRKDSLVRIMRRMAAVHGSQVYGFVPEAYILPNEYTKFVETYSEQDECSRAVWICKPADSSRGRNIFLLRNLEDLRYDSQFVIQRYIERPFLVGGYKCDLRVYVLVVSVHPLKAYIYRDGLVRLDDKLLWSQIINLVNATLLDLILTVPRNPGVSGQQNYFELFGFDVIIDEKMRPCDANQVNCSPALQVDCPVDESVKRPLVEDLLDVIYHPNVHDLVFPPPVRSSCAEPFSACPRTIGQFSLIFPFNAEVEALALQSKPKASGGKASPSQADAVMRAIVSHLRRVDKNIRQYAAESPRSASTPVNALRGDPPLVDRLFSSPVDQYKRFGKRPVAMAINVLLALITLAVAVEFINVNVRHASQSLRHFYGVLVASSDSPKENGGLHNRQKLIDSETDLAHSLVRLATSSVTLAESATNDYQFIRSPMQDGALTLMVVVGDLNEPVLLTLPNATNFHSVRASLDDDPEFSILGQHHFSSLMVPMKVHDTQYRDERFCLEWSLLPTFAENGNGQLALQLLYHVRSCAGVHLRLWAVVGLWSMLACGIASALVSLSSLRYRLEVVRKFLKDSSVQDKVTVVNTWLVFSLVGNAVQIVSVVYAFLVERPDIYTRLNLFGFSAAFALVSLVQYLAHFRSLYILYSTLAHGIPQILKFLVGVLPVYLSFVVCAVCLFGFHSHWFVSLGDSSNARFSLLNGDQIHDTFTNLKDVSVLGSRLFLYSFLALFIYVVLNIFITIAEDAFFTVKFMQEGAGPITNLPHYRHRVPAASLLHQNNEEISRMPKSVTLYRHRASDPLLKKLVAVDGEGSSSGCHGVTASHDGASTSAGEDASPVQQCDLQAQVAVLMRQSVEMQDQIRKLSEALLTRRNCPV